MLSSNLLLLVGKCHYIFIMSLHLHNHSLVRAKNNFYEHFQFFYSILSNAHYCTVFIPHIHQTRLRPFIWSSVHSFTLTFDLWVAWQQRCNSRLLHYVEAIISQHRGNYQPLSHEDTCTWRNAIFRTGFDSLYLMCKMHHPKWQLSGWHRGVELKQKGGNIPKKLAIFSNTSN